MLESMDKMLSCPSQSKLEKSPRNQRSIGGQNKPEVYENTLGVLPSNK